MSVAAPLVLREGDRARLESLIRSSSVRAGLVSRARIVLLAAEGLPNAEIARRTGTSRPTVVDWRSRYVAGGIKGLHDQSRSGRPPEIDEIDVVVATLAEDGRPPAHLGVTHSARLLTAELEISFATVVRIWRKWNLQPWRSETFKFSTDPELDAKIRDVVGLYLDPRAPRGTDDSSGGEKPSPLVTPVGCQKSCGVPEVGPGSLTSGDRWSDMIRACHCGYCT